MELTETRIVVYLTLEECRALRELLGSVSRHLLIDTIGLSADEASTLGLLYTAFNKEFPAPPR